jgi:hypothetical protein
MSKEQTPRITLALVASALLLCATQPASAQSPPAGDTRAARLAAEKAEKAKQLKPYEPNKAEVLVKKLEEQFLTGAMHWHPFFTSAYSGGGSSSPIALKRSRTTTRNRLPGGGGSATGTNGTP